jgi:hypothetical protein
LFDYLRLSISIAHPEAVENFVDNGALSLSLAFDQIERFRMSSESRGIFCCFDDELL